jgi:ATP-dependent protease HslVU (ClpYQ) peptidase subunit
MTVAAVRKYKDKIIIAADSQTSWGNVGKTLDTIKIIQEENFIAACAGSGMDSDLFRAYLRTHKPKAANENDLVDLLSEFVDWKNKRTGQSDISLQTLFIMDSRIFTIWNCGVEERKGEFAAIGCGMFLALGAMEIGADPIKAVEVAIKHDLYCGGEVTSVEIPIKSKNAST